MPIAATAARAHSSKQGKILIGHSWALPTTLTDGQVFVALANNDKTDDALVAARCDVAKVVEFRSNNRYDDPALPKIDLPSGQPVAMRPTAKHLRLIGLSTPLKLGDIFPIILDFQNAGEVEIQIYVETTPGE